MYQRGSFMPRLLVLAGLAVCALGLSLWAGLAREETHIWDVSLPWSMQEFHTDNALRFARTVEEASEGTLQMNVHPAAVLGLSGPESMRAVAAGVADAADMPLFQQVGLEPILGMESLPFLVRDQRDLRLLYDVLRPTIERVFTERGLKVLYIVPWPNQNIFTRFRPETLTDLEGVKIRTYDRLTSDLMRALGLSPLQMPSQDVVPALAAGAMDAVMTSATTASAQRYWDYLSHINRTNHVWISNVMAADLTAFEALPETLQKTVMETARALEPRFWDISAADDAAKLAILTENGMTVVEPPPEMLAAMEAAARPIWQDFIKRAGPGAERLLNDYLARREMRE